MDGQHVAAEPKCNQVAFSLEVSGDQARQRLSGVKCLESLVMQTVLNQMGRLNVCKCMGNRRRWRHVQPGGIQPGSFRLPGASECKGEALTKGLILVRKVLPLKETKKII